MAELWLTYDEYREGGGVMEGQENDAWPSYEDTRITWTPQALYLDESDVPTWQKELVKTDFEVERGDLVHIVVARYGDGDTFSHTDGYWCIMGASKDAEAARKLSRAIQNSTYTGREEGAANSYYQGYKPWDGYFSSLEYADVHSFVVT